MAQSPPSADKSELKLPEELEPSCLDKERPSENLEDAAEGENDAAAQDSPSVRADKSRTSSASSEEGGIDSSLASDDECRDSITCHGGHAQLRSDKALENITDTNLTKCVSGSSVIISTAPLLVSSSSETGDPCSSQLCDPQSSSSVIESTSMTQQKNAEDDAADGLCKNQNSGENSDKDLKTRHSSEDHGDNCPHACQLCYQKFVSSKDSKIHNEDNTGKRPFICRQCNRGFGDQSNLTVHERIHTGELPYTCGYCEKKFRKQSSLTRHEQLHRGERPYSCRYCERAFTRKAHLTVHERIHTNERPYSCRHCEKTFTAQSSVTRHERIHTDERPYTCRLCGRDFRTSWEKGRHEKTHLGK